MVAEFALAVVQEALERLDSCQNGDYSGILLRVEYLNRTIINFGHLPDSIVAGTTIIFQKMKSQYIMLWGWGGGELKQKLIKLLFYD